MILTTFMAWTQADIDALKSAMATGALSVSYAGPPARSVTYRSLEEMQALLSQMQQEVNGSSGTGTNYRLAATRSGL